MTQNETLNWFTNTASPKIWSYTGLFATHCYAVQDETNEFHFYIEFLPYSCESTEGCDECMSKTIRGGCYEEDLYILENGNILYENVEYTEDKFDDLLNKIMS